MRRALAIGVALWTVAAMGGAVAAAPADGVAVDRVVSVVNGVPVLDSEVALRARQIARAAAKDAAAPKGVAPEVSRKQAIDSLVDEALMVAAARDIGLTVTTAELDRALVEVEQENHLDRAGLVQTLSAEQITLDEYREGVERQLLLIKVQQALVQGVVLVDEPAVRAAYLRDKAEHPTIGDFEHERTRLFGQLYQAELFHVMQRWLAEQRQAAYLESKQP